MSQNPSIIKEPVMTPEIFETLFELQNEGALGWDDALDEVRDYIIKYYVSGEDAEAAMHCLQVLDGMKNTLRALIPDTI